MFDPMPCAHADRPLPEARPRHRLGLTPWGAAAGLPADTEAGDRTGQRRLLHLIVAAETLFDWLGEGLRLRPDALPDGTGETALPNPPRPALR